MKPTGINKIWTKDEIKILEKLDTPGRVQEFVDNIPYNTDSQCRSPRRVMRDRVAHCTEGAFFAAAALEFHGREPLILDMLAVRDDDHVIALYKERGHWGAVAKSNFSGLRFREPIYRSLRELVMSYFEQYFNTKGEKSLRAYSLPVNLKRFDRINWRTTGEDLEVIGDYLTAIKHFPVVTPLMIRNLRRADKRSFDAGMLGADPDGLYQA